MKVETFPEVIVGCRVVNPIVLATTATPLDARLTVSSNSSDAEAPAIKAAVATPSFSTTATFVARFAVKDLAVQITDGTTLRISLLSPKVMELVDNAEGGVLICALWLACMNIEAVRGDLGSIQSQGLFSGDRRSPIESKVEEADEHESDPDQSQVRSLPLQRVADDDYHYAGSTDGRGVY